MTRPEKQRLSRPLYEGLPWMYVLGLLGVLGGIVVLLRRRDYRAMRSEYGQADSTLSDLNGKD